MKLTKSKSTDDIFLEETIINHNLHYTYNYNY